MGCPILNFVLVMIFHRPSEDRLYSLGWKDNCFFHGTPETYMVRPTTAQERRSLNSWMEASRGEKSSTVHVTTNPERDEEGSSDLDDIILREHRISEEDMFLPQPLPILLDSLPHLLHTTQNAAAYKQNWVSDQLLENCRETNSLRMQTWLSNLFGRSLQLTKARVRPPSRELLLLNGNLEAVTVTDFLPILCRMGALEESFEALESDASNETTTEKSRRTTRRQIRNGRSHYFRTFSLKLQFDEAQMSSNELGRSMAAALLTYQGAAMAAS
jgi:hypothetical protein